MDSIVSTARSLFILVAIVLVGIFACVIAGKVASLLQVADLVKWAVGLYAVPYGAVKIADTLKPTSFYK